MKFKPNHSAVAVVFLLGAVLNLVGFVRGAAAQQIVAPHLDEVTLHLKWMHAFQFAGYYAAKEQGYYREEGLDVTIHAASITHQSMDTVLAGDAEYGVWGSALLNERLSGKPLVVLAVIFQHSPYVVVSRKDSNIRVPSDLVGRKVMVESGMGGVQLRAMLLHEGLSPDDVTIVPSTWRIDDIIDGKIDASMDYITDQPNQMRMRGVEPFVMRPADYGVDFYGDCLFTTEVEIEQHPERVAAFRRASLKGWEYAMSHVDEMIEHILTLPGVRQRGLSAAHLRYEAEQMQKLILPEFVKIGHINSARWKHIADTHVSLGLLEPDYSLDGFIYEPNPLANHRWLYAFLGSLVGIICIAGLAWIWNRELHWLVRRRTASLRESEAWFRGLVELSSDWIWEVDAAGVYTYVSPKIEDILGYKPEEIVGKTPFDLMSPDIAERMKESFRDLLVTGKPIVALENVNLHKDGRRIVLETSGVPVLDPAGKMVGYRGMDRDITERKRAEKQAVRFSRVLKGSLNEIYIADAETFRFLEVNCGAQKNLGYSIEELRDMMPWDIDTELTSAEMFEKLLKPLKEGIKERIQRETVHRRKDGTQYPVELHLQLMAGDDPVVVGIAADITERKRAEMELRKSEEQYRLLATNTTDTIWAADLGQNMTYVNHAVYNLMGYTPAECVGMNMVDFLPPESVETTREFIEQLSVKDKEGGVPQQRMDVQHICKDGTIIDVEITANLLFDDDGLLIGYQGRTVDISDRKKAEEEKVRLLAAINQAAESIVITDAVGTIEYVNPAFERITGYAKEEAIGQNPRILKSGEQGDAFYKAMWKTLATGQTWNGRFSNRKKDGTFYTEEATISPVKDSVGKVINYVAIKSDITIELVREGQIRQTQKMESVGRLAGGVAHDFNNILQTITGFCGLILAEMDDKAAQRQDVVEIQKAARLAGELTQQLLTFSREQPTQYAMVDLNAVLSGGEKMLRQALDDSFKLQLKLEPRLEPVSADASQILQIAMNLTVNARDAMPEGGTITLRTKNLEIQEKDLSDWPGSKVGNWVCFSLSDTGCGMDEKQLSHLFEPFYTTKAVGKGTGLGLSVVYGIVEKHGGWISVSSESGKGSIFKVCLPVHDAVESHEGDGPTDPDAFRGKQILLVEDDAVVRELTAEILQDVGYAVSVAADVAEAEQLFAGHHGEFDLLFSDVVLPDGNGIELAGVCRERQPGLPVLLFSGDPDKRTQVDRIQEKGFNYIRKPFNLKKLLDTVSQTITGIQG